MNKHPYTFSFFANRKIPKQPRKGFKGLIDAFRYWSKPYPLTSIHGRYHATIELDKMVTDSVNLKSIGHSGGDDLTFVQFEYAGFTPTYISCTEPYVDKRFSYESTADSKYKSLSDCDVVLGGGK